MIEIKNLTKKYDGKVAVEHLSLLGLMVQGKLLP